MSFPSSPTDGQVYIKENGVRYVYDSASNSWPKQIDPEKVAGNIKNGVEIDGVTGNYDFEEDNPITASTILNGKVGFVNGNKITGTGDDDLIAGNIKLGVTIFGVTGTADVAALEEETYVEDGAVKIYYRKQGKVYWLTRIYYGGNTVAPFIEYLSGSDEKTSERIATLLGITLSTYIQGDLLNGTGYYHNGTNWNSIDTNVYNTLLALIAT